MIIVYVCISLTIGQCVLVFDDQCRSFKEVIAWVLFWPILIAVLACKGFWRILTR